MIPLDRVRELLSLAPGPHGGTLMDTSMVHDLAAQVLALAEALATAERDLAASRQAHAGLAALVRAYLAALDVLPGDLATINAAVEREREARAALDAALGRCQ